MSLHKRFGVMGCYAPNVYNRGCGGVMVGRKKCLKY